MNKRFGAYRPGRPEFKALNAKEAALLYMAADDSQLIDENNVMHITIEMLSQQLGDMWKAKLNTAGALREITLPEHDQSIVLVDAKKILQIATSPISKNEISLLFSRRFKGAQKAINFMEGRMNSPSQSQEIFCSEHFVNGFLGPLWKDRLAVTALSSYRTDPPSQEEPQVYFEIRPFYEFAKASLYVQAGEERNNPGRRRY